MYVNGDSKTTLNNRGVSSELNEKNSEFMVLQIDVKGSSYIFVEVHVCVCVLFASKANLTGASDCSQKDKSHAKHHLWFAIRLTQDREKIPRKIPPCHA